MCESARLNVEDFFFFLLVPKCVPFHYKRANRSVKIFWLVFLAEAKNGLARYGSSSKTHFPENLIFI